MKKIKKALLGVAMLSALTLSFGLVACDTTTTPTPGGDDHTTHVDTNPHDGICDVCEETIENPHPDENNDNLCDVGGESLITKTTYEYKVRTTDGVSQVTETMGMTFLKLDSAAVPYDFGNGDLNLMGGFMKVYRAYDVELTLSSDGTYELNVNQYMIEDDESSDIYDQKFEPGSELYAEWWSKSTGTYTSAEGTVSITSTYEYYKFPMLGALIDNNMSPSCSYARVTDADYYYGEWDSNYTGEGEDEVKEYLKAQFPDTTFTVEAGKIIKWKETGAEEPEPEEPEEPGEEEPGEEEPNTDPVVEDGKLTLKADGSATPLVLTAAGKATISVEIPGVTTLSLTSNYTWDGENLEIEEASGMGGQAKVAYTVAEEDGTYTITATFNDGAMTFTFTVTATELNARFPVAE